MLHFPDHYKSLREGPEKEEIRSNVEKSILLFSYDSDLHELDPIFERLSRVPHASLIKEVALFAANTWDVGIIPFRESLIWIHK